MLHHQRGQRSEVYVATRGASVVGICGCPAWADRPKVRGGVADGGTACIAAESGELPMRKVPIYC